MCMYVCIYIYICIHIHVTLYHIVSYDIMSYSTLLGNAIGNCAVL